MARITVKAKVREALHLDGTLARRYVQLPELDRKHCDMSAFRQHPRFGMYANSDLFPGMLRRIRSELSGASGMLSLDALPSNVTVDESGFLAVVQIEV